MAALERWLYYTGYRRGCIRELQGLIIQVINVTALERWLIQVIDVDALERWPYYTGDRGGCSNEDYCILMSAEKKLAC